MLRWRSIAARAVLAVTATAFGLELGLQALAAFGVERAQPDRQPEGAIVILCVGDSHTYGAPLPASESYPAQLQERLREDYPGKDFWVINVGIPGANTSMVLSRLPAWLARYQPDIVLFWAGVNNAWNVAETPDDEGLAALLFRSRVYRLISRLRHDRIGADDARPALLSHREGHSRWQVGGQLVETRRGSPATAAWQARLRADLSSLVALGRSAGFRLGLFTYPVLSPALEPVNAIIDEVAQASGVLTVSGPFNLIHARADGHRDPELIVDAAGPHPTGILYSYIVDALMHHMPYHLAALEQEAPARTSWR